MNKTIIININGTVFHIEEDAYEVLKNYMTNVKRHFADAEDSFEITTDIENRIAEMFSEILNAEAKQVIVAADVDTIIAQMGTVEDFENTDTEHQTGYGSNQAFADNRKLFRDTDNHLLGGVCAGIANYFNIDKVWVRLAFALTFVVWGTGLLLYIILWAIVPKAITRADKMAMKGEPLDLQGFKKNFEEEAKNVHETLSDANTQARPFVYQFRDFVSDFFHHLGMFIRGAGRLILKIFGILILMMCLGFTIATIVGFVVLMVYGNDVYHVFPFSALNYGYTKMLYVSAFALVFIPILAIALLTIRVIFNGNALGRSTAYTMLIVWIVAVTVVIYYSAQISRDFKDSASFSQSITLKPAPGNVYHLKLNDAKFLTRDDSLQMDIDTKFNGRIILDDRHASENMPHNVSLFIEQADVKQVMLVESFSAKGATERTALKNARNAIYNFTQQDSLLTFDRRLRLPHNSLWRDQDVELTLKVPYGTELVIDQELNEILRSTIDIDDCKDKNKMPNWTTAPFLMTDSGLTCKVILPPSTEPVKH